jgi:hypothetical protein
MFTTLAVEFYLKFTGVGTEVTNMNFNEGIVIGAVPKHGCARRSVSSPSFLSYTGWRWYLGSKL